MVTKPSTSRCWQPEIEPWGCHVDVLCALPHIHQQSSRLDRGTCMAEEQPQREVHPRSTRTLSCHGYVALRLTASYSADHKSTMPMKSSAIYETAVAMSKARASAMRPLIIP